MDFNPHNLNLVCEVARKHRVKKLQVGDVMIEFELSELPAKLNSNEEPRIVLPEEKPDPLPTEEDFLLWSTKEPLSNEKQASDDVDPA